MKNIPKALTTIALAFVSLAARCMETNQPVSGGVGCVDFETGADQMSGVARFSNWGIAFVALSILLGTVIVIAKLRRRKLKP